MINILFIGALFLGLLSAKVGGVSWPILVIGAIVILGSFLIRLINNKKDRRAAFLIVDKKKSVQTLIGTLIVYGLLLGQSIYMMQPDDRPYFYFLLLAYLIALPTTDNYRVRYLLNDDSLTYKNNNIPYSKILRTREDDNHLIIDTTKYINHIKIRKNLLNADFTDFLENKIKFYFAQHK